MLCAFNSLGLNELHIRPKKFGCLTPSLSWTSFRPSVNAYLVIWGNFYWGLSRANGTNSARKFSWNPVSIFRVGNISLPLIYLQVYPPLTMNIFFGKYCTNQSYSLNNFKVFFLKAIMLHAFSTWEFFIHVLVYASTITYSSSLLNLRELLFWVNFIIVRQPTF